AGHALHPVDVPLGFVSVLLETRRRAQRPGIGMVSPRMRTDQGLLADALRGPIGDVTQDLVVIRAIVVLDGGIGRHVGPPAAPEVYTGGRAHKLLPEQRRISVLPEIGIPEDLF